MDITACTPCLPRAKNITKASRAIAKTSGKMQAPASVKATAVKVKQSTAKRAPAVTNAKTNKVRTFIFAAHQCLMYVVHMWLGYLSVASPYLLADKCLPGPYHHACQCLEWLERWESCFGRDCGCIGGQRLVRMRYSAMCSHGAETQFFYW